MMSKLIAAIAVLLLFIAMPTAGDNLILAPRGTTLTTGQFRSQVVFSPDRDHSNYFINSVGLQQFEFAYTHIEYSDSRREELFGAQWNVLPETFITPAIGVGIRDAGSQSKEGWGIYGAITKHMPINNYTRFVDDFSVTIGLGAKAIHGAFCGVEARLPLYFVGQVEYDGDTWNSALSWQPVDTFRIKIYRIRYDNYFGAEFLPVQF